MTPFFTDLGRHVLAQWKAQNFSLERFPGIARQALEANPPAEQVEVGELIREFLLHDEQPFQSQSGFGQPELIVYDDPRFYIQILFWLEGTTDIHQHKFSGAFHVLSGSSLHSRFSFDKVQPVSAHLRVGELGLKDSALLETGSTVEIVSGGGYIHSLFHLDTPSLTVVIRTHSDPGTGPQFTYLPPHLAVDPFYNDALTNRRKQLLDVLERTGEPDYSDLVGRMVGALDFERGFFILQNCVGALRDLGAWEEVWEIFAGKHGALAGYVAPTLEEIIWRDGLVGLRSSVTDVEHRFFLALLLNVPGRADLLSLVAQRCPGDPTQTVLRWAEELTTSSEAGTWILDAQFPESLDVDADEQPGLFLDALGRFLQSGRSGPARSTADEPLRQAFAASSLRALVT